ncbi:MAG TPA: bifunctional 2-polyprenyl-6-hydroxyphenol methylase/3-demethylubiquinol 3-O-methyltransferase UbiG [Candidatus Megaira endosymbiont of Nemacystus decipiens]|nr:bifunctional 2-polyprenyl-6-hydroxyphenol methylase/3-demethylubiquinol 3-O-methyltransferase UbiG [Candidatus Megaera endosymbiont of Nemacystus decipiens]
MSSDKKILLMHNSSIDYTELNKFNKTAHQWWDPEGEFKTLHQINPLRIEYITKTIESHYNSTPNKTKILDIGCGGGLVSAPMSRLGFDMSALDANESNIKAISDYSQDHNLNIDLFHETVENHVLRNKKYDVILCLEVIEHVAHVSSFLNNLNSMLKPDGILILSTINRTRCAYFYAIVMAEYLLGWVPKNTHDYNKFLKPSEIVSKLSKTDLKLFNLQGLSYLPLKNRWKLSNDIDINYFASFKKDSILLKTKK